MVPLVYYANASENPKLWDTEVKRRSEQTGILDTQTRLDTLARIIQEHQAGIWRYLTFLGCSPNQAEDITQEAFLALVKVDFHDQSYPQTHRYIRTIAYRLFLSARQSLRHELAGLSVEAVEDAWQRTRDHDGGAERIDALNKCMAELEPTERKALDLQYAQKMKRSEIAASIGLSDGGTKNLLGRVKERLKRCVEARLAT